MDKSIEEMTGEKAGTPTPKFDQITLDGKEGKVHISYNATKERGEDGFFPRDEIVAPFPITFLIRKARLIKTSAKGIRGYSDEYQDKNDVVAFYDRNENDEIVKKDEMPAYLLKDKYELKTEAIVYSRYKGEVVRFRAKGLSIQPEKEKKDDFYTYIFSYRPDEGQNFWKVVTEVGVEPKMTDNGQYYRFTFKKKRDLTPDEIAEVEKQIVDTYGKVSDYEQTKKESQIDINTPDEPETYPDEDIKPEDIPF